MTDKIWDIREKVKSVKPLIHCITNPISINQCANAILSVGAKPIMAEHPKEVCEITDTADALMLNTGNITDARMESIMFSIGKAKEKDIPSLLDVVGIACSRLRREYVLDLLKTSVPSVIKGNYSEIVALQNRDYFSKGVDSELFSDESYITKTVTELAKEYQTVILATGKTDVVSDGKRTVHVKNGTPELCSVTGTGCMLGSLCATFMAVADPMDATVTACCYFGISGELAETKSGYGSYMVNLMDRISTLGKEEIRQYCNMEER